MAKRCKHLNAELLEVAEEWISHNFENGQYTDSWHDAGKILAPLIVKCHDCKRTFRYRQFGKRPQWVQAMEEQVQSRQ